MFSSIIPDKLLKKRFYFTNTEHVYVYFFIVIIFAIFGRICLLILGRNGLQEFQRIATQQGWLILAYETFDRTPDPSDIDVTLQLSNILDTGKEKWA